MTVLETPRLLLRKFTAHDGEFIIRLVNSPGWLEFIGDRNIHSLEDARLYLVNGPMYSYNRFGFGPYMVQLKANGTPVGMCSLIKRDTLDDVDIGFAFLPEHSRKGYAYEASAATLSYAQDALGIHRVVAITNTDNAASIQLLKKLGLAFEKKVQFPEEKDELLLFATEKTNP